MPAINVNRNVGNVINLKKTAICLRKEYYDEVCFMQNLKKKIRESWRLTSFIRYY